MVRDRSGRFTKGNPGGPGRPPRATEAEYLGALADMVSLADWREIAEKAVQQAKRGDATARKWLSDYLMGAPLQKTDITSKGEKIVVTWNMIEAGNDGDA